MQFTSFFAPGLAHPSWLIHSEPICADFLPQDRNVSPSNLAVILTRNQIRVKRHRSSLQRVARVQSFPQCKGLGCFCPSGEVTYMGRSTFFESKSDTIRDGLLFATSFSSALNSGSLSCKQLCGGTRDFQGHWTEVVASLFRFGAGGR